MNLNKRELNEHVEFESQTYYAAFAAELEACAQPMWGLLSHCKVRVRLTFPCHDSWFYSWLILEFSVLKRLSFVFWKDFGLAVFVYLNNTKPQSARILCIVSVEFMLAHNLLSPVLGLQVQDVCSHFIWLYIWNNFRSNKELDKCLWVILPLFSGNGDT